MTTKKTPVTQRRTYTTAQANCLVYTIEFVAPIASADIAEHLNDALERLRCVGAAEVTNRVSISERFDPAAQILTNRMLESFKGD